MSRVNPVGTSEGPDNPSGVDAVGSRHPYYIVADFKDQPAEEVTPIRLPPPRETCEASEDSPGSAHLRGATGLLIQFMLRHGQHGGSFCFRHAPDALRLACSVCFVEIEVLRSSLVHPSGETQRAQASVVSEHPAVAGSGNYPSTSVRCVHCQSPLECRRCGLSQ